jgi:hypothetical protein
VIVSSTLRLLFALFATRTTMGTPSDVKAAQDLEAAVRRKNQQSSGPGAGIAEAVAEAKKEVYAPDSPPEITIQEANDLAIAARAAAVPEGTASAAAGEVGQLFNALTAKIKYLTEHALPLDPLRLMIEEQATIDLPFMRGNSMRIQTLPAEVEVDVQVAVQRLLEEQLGADLVSRIKANNAMQTEFDIAVAARRSIQQAAYLATTVVGTYSGPPDSKASATPAGPPHAPSSLDILGEPNRDARIQKIMESARAWLRRSQNVLIEWSVYYNAAAAMVRKALSDENFIENGLKD